MITKISTAALTVMMAALPLTARADLYINIASLKAVWQTTDGCDFARTSGAFAVYHCKGSSGKMALTDYSHRYQGSCTLDWWGTRGGHWHYTFSKNDFGKDNVMCYGHWQNSNTLNVGEKSKV